MVTRPVAISEQEQYRLIFLIEKNMKRFIFTLLILLCYIITKGQNLSEQHIVPQSPNVSSLIQYANCPISYYSGTSNISIPLYDINIDALKLPISLNYHSSGIKVAQEASWVGLGWSLNAGGCISRSVQCYDDFLEYSYPDIPVQQGYYAANDIIGMGTQDYYTYYHTNLGIKMHMVIDSEPDIFYYSFAGYSGKFVLDKSRGAVLFNKSDGLKIEVKTDAFTKKYFIITTPDGTKYVFNTKEVAHLYHQEGSLHNNNSNATIWDKNENSFTELPIKYVSSWFLTKIITSNGRVIFFDYEKELYKAPAQESCVKYNYLSHSGNTTECVQASSTPHYFTSKAVHDTYRLRRISWENGYVDFISSNREDIAQTNYPLKKLENIKVYNKDGMVLKNLNFSYKYMNSTKTGTYTYVFKRLLLDGVTDVIDTNYKYLFEYFDGTLPAKNSKNVDYWGYYNGQDYGNKYYCSTFFNNKYYEGANKKSCLNYLKRGMLKSIHYPTGGKETFTYEENAYTGSNTTSGNATEKNQNVEIYNKKLIDEYPSLPSTESFTFVLTQTTDVYIDGYMEVVGSNKDANYNYSNDVVRIRVPGSSTPKFSHTSSELYGKDYLTINRKVTLPAGTYLFEALLAAPDTYVKWSIKYNTITFPSSTVICNGGGLRIAQIDGGGKQRKFTYSPGLILIDPVTAYLNMINCGNSGSISGTFLYLIQTSESTVPLSSFRNENYIGYDQVKETVGKATTVYAYYNQQEEQIAAHPFMITDFKFQNGLPQYIQYCQGNMVIKEESFVYDTFYSQTIKAFKFVPSDYATHSYDYSIEWYKIKKINTKYKDNSRTFTVETNYTYNNLLFQKSKSFSSDGKVKEEKILYPCDYTDELSKKMTADNYISYPLEKLSLINGKVTAGQKMAYKDTLDMYLPAVEYTLDAKTALAETTYSSFYKPRIYYDTYNSRGKLLQKREDGTPTVYLWSYKGEYPVAVIRNATYTEVATHLHAKGITAEDLCERQLPTENDMMALKALRTAIPKAIVTIYTYKPLIGINSITDARGVTTYYDYDNSGRLMECYYKEGTNKYILKHYNYHYANH